MHKSITDDFDNHHFAFEERFCPACADQTYYGRVVQYRDDEATPKDKDGQPAWPRCRKPGHAADCRCGQRPDDGRHIYVRHMTPDEVEQRKSGG